MLRHPCITLMQRIEAAMATCAPPSPPPCPASRGRGLVGVCAATQQRQNWQHLGVPVPSGQHQPIRPMDSAGEHGAVDASDSAFVGVGEGHAGGNGRKQVEDCCSRVPVPSPRTSVHIMASGSSSAGGGEPQGLCSAAMPMRSGVLSSETQSNKSDEFRSCLLYTSPSPRDS